jgi:hypothetical protein
MHKKTPVLITAGIIALLGVGSIIAYHGSEGAIRERYPDIHPDDVKAAHRKMFRAALKGEFANVDTDDDAVMEKIFLSYVNNG